MPIPVTGLAAALSGLLVLSLAQFFNPLR